MPHYNGHHYIQIHDCVSDSLVPSIVVDSLLIATGA